jgi:hypothetical protein
LTVSGRVQARSLRRRVWSVGRSRTSPRSEKEPPRKGAAVEVQRRWQEVSSRPPIGACGGGYLTPLQGRQSSGAPDSGNRISSDVRPAPSRFSFLITGVTDLEYGVPLMPANACCLGRLHKNLAIPFKALRTAAKAQERSFRDRPRAPRVFGDEGA